MGSTIGWDRCRLIRQFCLGVMALLFGSPFIFSGTPLRAAEYPKPQGWDPLVEAARKEGTVSIYGRPTPESQQALVDFERAYPGIKVNTLPIPGAAMVTRLAAEYRARKHLADVAVSTTQFVLKPMGLFAPLKPAMILPEVLDHSAWWGKQHWWYDASEPYVMLGFQGIAQAYMSYNTNLVDPGKITSWMDLLNPKWKGKIVSTDPRRRQIGGGPIRFVYDHPSLGPGYLERLFREMDITLTADSRQMGDWLGQGRFHLALGLGSLNTAVAAGQGLPIAPLMTQRFKEGSPITLSGGGITLVQHAPHPHAAKLFVNWFLSRDGQMGWQRRTKNNSLRTDIPKEGLRPETVPMSGQNYLFLGGEKYDRLQDESDTFLRKILEQQGK